MEVVMVLEVKREKEGFQGHPFRVSKQEDKGFQEDLV
jgi:hypothetical protein